ncbi:MAG: D-glycero-alpha-D-manno-heptose-1,7-bisphosphate 7-phosphatase [Betaproteobacteria bacterium]
MFRQQDFEFVPGTLAAAHRLHEAGWALVVVTNQSGIGRGLYTEADYRALDAWMRAEFSAAGAPLAATYFCPHHPRDAQGAYLRECDCRKPAPGMLLAAARELNLDLAASAMFGDKPSDLLAARSAGVPWRILLGTDGRAVPMAPAEAGLATAAYASLAAAVEHGDFLSASGAQVAA